ncbi:MAG: Zn-dependent hydrolase [Pseudomonadota bacterium]
MDNIRINQERLWASIMAMAEIGATSKGGSCRLALTDEDKAARELFASWCEEAGCEIAVDEIGNMFARRPGADTHAPAVATGSHLDTQPTGGKFDGVFGVLAGLEVVRTLNDHGIKTQTPIEIVNWTNEEGSRFAPAMLASGVHAGLFDLDFAMSRADVDGVTFGEALRAIGYDGDEPVGKRQFKALFEAHIEQGPVLEHYEETIGVVTGGQGQRWYDVSITGRDSHTGTTPMERRKDALIAAAMLVQSVEQIALAHPPGVATVGALAVSPNSRNTIPGSVELTIDVRNPDDDALSSMAAAIARLVERVQRDRDVAIACEQIWYSPPTPFDDGCVNAVRNATVALGYPYRDMVSGAGHDAVQVANVTPTAMIFVPCADGLSHNELESAESADLAAGANVLLHAVLDRAGIAGDS